MPTHHVHISTGFAFVVLLFLAALIGGLLWYRVAMRRAAQPRAPQPRPAPPRRPDTTTAFRSTRDWDRPRPASTYRSAPYSYTGPTASSPAPASSGISAGEGFIGGLVVGNMLGASEGHHTSTPSYDLGPSPDSGSPSSCSSDSGFSYDSGSSSGSSDSGSSGGFDVSW